MTLAAIQKAESDRTVEILKIDSVEKKVRSHASEPLSLSTVKTQLKKSYDIREALSEIHRRILHNQPEDPTPHNVAFTDLNDRLDFAIAELTEIIDNFQTSASAAVTPTPPPNPAATTSTSGFQHTLKLPTIHLPDFDGRFDDWPSFSDLFKATVDSNPSLSDAQKLQYLKSYVKGEPEKMIKSFIIVNENYNEAWQVLSTRYDNKREIIHSIIKKLLHQPQMKNENVSSLQTLLNSTAECVRSLRVLGQPVDSWDSLLVVIIVEKLDPESKSEWAKTLKDTKPTTFKEITDFLEMHIRSLIAKGTVVTKGNSMNQNKPNNVPHKQARTNHVFTSHSTPSCTFCKESHYASQCSKFLEMDVTQRKSTVGKSGACFNCLRVGHSVQDCKSKNTCNQCRKKHHTLLHVNNNTNQNAPIDGATPSSSSLQTVRTSSAVVSAQLHKLLKTAIVDVKDSFGRKRPCRIFLDEGSDADYISEKCASALGLRRQPTDVRVEGIAGCTAAQVKWKTSTRLYSKVHNASIEVDEMYILPKVTGNIPRIPCEATWSHIQGLQLADPSYSQPGEIDILLGSGVVPYILRDGKKQGKRNEPVAQNSIFGWILSGNVSISQQSLLRTYVASCKLDEIVQRFWELEQVPNRKPLTQEEMKCEQHFVTTHYRKPDGRFVVRLPFNSKVSTIGETREKALQRLYQLERRFMKYPQHHESYKKFIQEYIDLNHMSPVSDKQTNKFKVYIPHHFVIKEDSSTTKLRVVFDASMKSTSGTSLNDALMVGPTIQEDLFTLLLRFRIHNVAMKADVAKMYRQFEVNEDDRNYQTILWRESKDEPIREYTLNTLTYGTGSASFLATRCLTQLAQDEQLKYPLAADAIKSSSYVDDYLGGAESTNSAITLYNELVNLCEAGGMQIRKWCSSDPEVLAQIPPEMKEEDIAYDFDNDSTVKALGVKWKPQGDYFYFDVEQYKPQLQITKREILSEIARTFDPIGWLTPTTITAKILFQELWKESTDWDEPVKSEVKLKWDNYRQELQKVSRIKISRRIIPSQPVDIQLHGFADASEKALSAVVYLRCTNEKGNITAQLITSRSKVAPLKQTSLPRLELCAALLLSETIEQVKQCYNFEVSVHAWTDSMITLKWITSPSRKWKTFVANRVAAIQDIIQPIYWNHVSSGDNPADLPSRGIPAQSLVSSSFWWHGPAWLSTPTFPVSSSSPPTVEEITKEERTTVITALATQKFDSQFNNLLSKFSSLTTTIKITAWLIRFTQYISKSTNLVSGPITPAEMMTARLKIIQLAQQDSFAAEIKCLAKQKPLSTTSKIKQLAAFIDENGLLRVGGRLHNSELAANTKHPLIIPANHPVTELLILEYHQNLLHAGFTLTLSMLRRKYWIIRGRDIVRRFISKCVTCRKIKATQVNQLMGNLPSARVSPTRPFLHAGVDFAGPFHLKLKRGRGGAVEKWYMCVFICFSTKAIHLEAVSSLSSSAFIATYKRFIARRGISTHLYSDCGTNFIGADRDMKTMLQQCKTELGQQLANHGTTWVFNPPSAPHQGGLWEAAVKSAKHHLKRIVGTSILSIEEFNTLLCNVEACLNSRPLCPISSDPLDFNALTPGHFLVGEPLTSIPEPDLTWMKQNRLDHWQRVQQMSQHFWKRWHNEYLLTLQARHKWNKTKRNLSVGDLVIIRDETLPPTKWRLGRITETHPGTDGLVRNVTVKTATGELLRPIIKLCVILYNDEC